MPRVASSVTTAPDFNTLVAFAAPTITGISIASPATAAWEFNPPASVTMPAAFFRMGKMVFEVWGITRISPSWNSDKMCIRDRYYNAQTLLEARCLGKDAGAFLQLGDLVLEMDGNSGSYNLSLIPI